MATVYKDSDLTKQELQIENRALRNKFVTVIRMLENIDLLEKAAPVHLEIDAVLTEILKLFRDHK